MERKPSSRFVTSLAHTQSSVMAFRKYFIRKVNYDREALRKTDEIDKSTRGSSMRLKPGENRRPRCDTIEIKASMGEDEKYIHVRRQQEKSGQVCNDNNGDNLISRITTKTEDCPRIPPFLPPIHKQHTRKLLKRDFVKPLDSIGKVTVKDVKGLRYLRLPSVRSNPLNSPQEKNSKGRAELKLSENCTKTHAHTSWCA